MKIPVHGYAASTLEIYGEEDWTTDAPEIEAACAAFRRGNKRALVFDRAAADAVLDGLTTLSNTEDEQAVDRALRKHNPESARFARLASDGLSRVSVRLCAELRG